jgi:hypothetical protein
MKAQDRVALAWGPRTTHGNRPRHPGGGTFRRSAPGVLIEWTQELFLADGVLLHNSGERTGAGVSAWRRDMNGLIYLIGLIVVVMFILSFLGLR